jgi:hypothetical protein
MQESSIKKYLEFMTGGDLSTAVLAGYLDADFELTEKALVELTDVARVKQYPVVPTKTVSEQVLGSLFKD